jgi:D-alanyl-D-alanine carboxypeptidase/D-alanyl-D-alanine-endopeptidase (penicillin-binding protein 4)
MNDPHVTRRGPLAAFAALLVVACSLPSAALAQGDTAPDPPSAVTAPAVKPAAKPATRKKVTTRRRRTRHASSKARAPLHYTTPFSTVALASDMGTFLTARVRSGEWGVMVVSLTRGDTLFAYNAGEALQPASNMKLFTTALALDEFGADHEFHTDVMRTGPITPDGTLHGDLILRGGGDPGLSRRFYGNDSGAMDSLAALATASGIRRVTGNLIADASAFDPQRIPEGWQTRYLQSSYAARVSALSLNENLATVVIRPGRKVKQAAAVTLEPAADLPLTAVVITREGRGARIMARSTPTGGIEVRGWIGTRAGQRSYVVVVEDPTAYTAGAFRHALEARGVTITGPTRYAVTPPEAVTLTSLSSPPLSQLIAQMNGESINLYAELLFRDAARKVAGNGVGSAEGGSSLLQTLLTGKAGVASGAVTTVDGSGLSVMDKVTPRSLVKLLAFANQAPWSAAFHESLPIAGTSELLRNRMRSTPAQGNLHAKTGTTNTVISLGGYVTARDGEQLAFAFIYNGTDRWNAKETIDAMGATLAGFAR